MRAEIEQFGIAAIAERSRRNKLRLPGVTSCVFSAHTHGKTCLIAHCTSNCPTRKALERLSTRKVASKVERTFEKAKSMMERLKETELVERLTVLRAAWILGSGRMPQPWCRLNQKNFKKNT